MLIRQVNNDVRDWTGPWHGTVWVTDRGFTSSENWRYLRARDQHHLITEKLRSGSAAADAA